MSSITAQQAKLDLELVPKEKRLEIRKCNGRFNLGKIQREPTFQVVLDALALTPCYSTFLITKDGNDEDDSNNEQESSGEDSDQKNDSDDDKTQSNNENESDSEHKTDKNESGSEPNQEEDEEVKDEFVKASSTDSNDEDEKKITDKAEGDEDEEMDYTTSQVRYDAAMTNIQQGNENPKIVQVIEDAHVTLSTIPQKNEVLVTSSSHSFDLAAIFLNFSDIPHTDAEIVSPMEVNVHHEVPSQQTPTLLTVPVSVISDSSPVFSTSTLLDFALVFQFNNRVTTLEKEVAELKKDPLHTQVTALVDDHLDTRLGATREEFKNFLSASLNARITEHVKNQLPHILPEEVSNFAPSVIQKMIQELLEDAVLANDSSQPQSSYETAATLIEFELKKILIDKMDKSESYLVAPEQRECYEGLRKSYDLDKSLFSIYDKVYSLKRSRKDKDKDEDPSARSDQVKELEFEVAYSNMPQDQEENLGNDDVEPKEKDNPSHVYKLKKSLYGLKQAPRAWTEHVSMLLLMRSGSGKPYHKALTSSEIGSLDNLKEHLNMGLWVLKGYIMSSITAQQIKLDLELVPKEKRLEIRKCNGRLNPGKIQREPTFQVVLDALALIPCYSAFLITANGQDFDELPTDEEIVTFLRDLGHTREINLLNDVVVDQMHQPWRTFDALINRS
ncbi:integrase, catalytic region, zinc finger, CCHC-type containing protein [Tanacetum coccineum]